MEDEAIAKVISGVSVALLNLADWINADREVVRDGNGKVVAVDRKRPMPRAKQAASDIETALISLADSLSTLTDAVEAERELVSEGGKLKGSRRKR